MSKFASGAAALAFILSMPAMAHVSADPVEAQPGSYFRTALRVGHGCGPDKPTTAIRIEIPEGITKAAPQPKTGWNITVEKTRPLRHATEDHGSGARTTISAITWSGGNLPNDQFDEFGLVLKLPDAPGAQIALAVTQSCGTTEIRWDQLAQAGQKPHSLEHPAALIRIAGEPAAGAGNIRVQQPFARATPAKVGGAFMVLRNDGAAADRLLKAESPVAASVELHTHVKDGDAMRMRKTDDIPLPAGGEARLEPGGHHIMLIGLKQPLKEGTHFPLTLTFEKAGRITVEVPVQKAGAGGGHQHH